MTPPEMLVTHGRLPMNGMLLVLAAACSIRVVGFTLSPLQKLNFDQAFEDLLERLHPANTLAWVAELTRNRSVLITSTLVTGGLIAFLQWRALRLHLGSAGYQWFESVVTAAVIGFLFGLLNPVLLQFCLGHTRLVSGLIRTAVLSVAATGLGVAAHFYLPTNWQDPVQIVSYVIGLVTWTILISAAPCALIALCMIGMAVASSAFAGTRQLLSGLLDARWAPTSFLFLGTAALGYARFVLLAALR